MLEQVRGHQSGTHQGTHQVTNQVDYMSMAKCGQKRAESETSRLVVLGMLAISYA